MKISMRPISRGFTLIEMLLVMVIISSILYMSMGYLQQRTLNVRVDRTSQQMQQILNAGVAYYVNNGTWPTSLTTDLQAGGYLPTGATSSPWGSTSPYSISSTTQVFSVSITLPSTMASQTEVAQIIAGKLPLATVGTGANVGQVTASINIPAQNLNNAPGINFAGLYHHGACVPVPTCPVSSTGSMTASVFFIPVSVSGSNAAPPSTDVYSISSFTAYASGPASATPAICVGSTSDSLGDGGQPACSGGGSSGLYWRACLQVVTEAGNTAGTGTGANSWGQNVTVAAFTRCAITNEPSGSNFSVYSN